LSENFNIDGNPIVVVVSRNEVEARDTSSVISVLKSCLASPERTRSLFGKLDVTFHGYDQDKRELHEIPEVREYVYLLDQEFPYWLFFLRKNGFGLQAIMHCFMPPYLTEQARKTVWPQRLDKLLSSRWFPAMNQICVSVGFSEAQIETLTNDVCNYFIDGPPAIVMRLQPEPESRAHESSEVGGGINLRLPCPHADTVEVPYSFTKPWPESKKTECCRAFSGMSLENKISSGKNRPLCLGANRESEVYRFFWDSSNHGDAVVRIAEEGSKITLRVDYDRPYHLTSSVHNTRVLTSADWSELQSAITFCQFWSLPHHPWRHQGLDGAGWTIEGRHGERYNCVESWSPGGGAFYDLGCLFFALAKLDVRLY
jgi:hypothetical protein